jgi:hypothetical protein
MEFKQAERKQRKARVTLVGVAGSGKTLTALIWARVFAQGGKVALIDTERKSACLYANEIPPGEKEPLVFDALELETFEVENYIAAMRLAAERQYPVLVIDSLTHAWRGEGGILDQKDKMGGAFNAWAKLTPKQEELMKFVLTYPGHVIVTMRAKTEYVVEKNEKGKDAPRRVGMAPQQRDNMEFEFDLFGMMDVENALTIEKSRALSVPELRVGQIHRKPTKALAEKLLAWLSAGAPEVATPMPAIAPQPAPAITAAVTPASPAPAGPPPSLSIEDRITRAKAILNGCKSLADVEAFGTLMNDPSTPTEIRVAIASDYIAKKSEFVAPTVTETAEAPAAQ